MYGNGLIFVDNLPCDDRGSLNFQVIPSKLPYFFKKFKFVIIGAGQIFKHVNKTALFSQKVYLVIIGALRISKWHRQNCLIFVKVSTHDIGVVQIFKSSQNF